MISYAYNVKIDVYVPEITLNNISYSKIFSDVDAYIQKISADKINSVIGNILTQSYKLITDKIFAEDCLVEVIKARPDAQIYIGKYKVNPPAVIYPSHSEYILEKVQ